MKEISQSRRRFLMASAGIPYAVNVAGTAGALETPPGNSFDYEQQQKRIKANEKIQEARKAALTILKPTARELEHGLELHANSVVAE